MQPGVQTGRYFFRRGGPAVAEVSLAYLAEQRGYPVHPYNRGAPARVRYGRYGFRDEYPPVSGGVALVGSSYAEAGFAEAEDTVVGWLRRDHGVPASNFGISFTKGYTVLHYLEQYVLPTQPSHVIRLFAERFDFIMVMTELEQMRTYRQPTRQLEGFPRYLAESARGILKSGYLRARASLSKGVRALVPLALLPNRHRGEPLPIKATIDIGGTQWAVDPITRPPTQKQLDEAGPVVADVLRKIKDLTEAHGTTFSVVYVPSHLRLLGGFWVTPPAGSGDVPDAYAMIERRCHELDIPIVDATLHLRASLQRGEFIINPVFDDHLNAEGMRLVAGVMAKHLDLSTIAKEDGSRISPSNRRDPTRKAR
jgi:hypothetical protein